MYAFGALHTLLRLIKPTAQDPTDSNQPAIYKSITTHSIFVGIIFLLGGIGLFHSLPSSASIIKSPTEGTVNSQRVALLQTNYSVKIPEAIGGPNDIMVDNRLALLSPQVGIVTGTTSIKNIEVDPDGIVVYIVQEGDTLSEIAESFDISTNTIKWENNLGKTIKPGQELRMLPVTGVRHTIAKGDTFGKIANMYDVEIDDIRIYNDIKETELVPGKKIMVPNGVKQTVVVSSSKSSTKSGGSKVSSVSSSNGYYIKPAVGVTTSVFGPRKGSYHYGNDIAAPKGTPIVAMAAGTVIKTSCG